MNFNKQTLFNIVITIAIVIAAYLAIVGFKCLYMIEGFSDFSNSVFSYASLDKNYVTTNLNDYMVNGMVYKQVYNGEYNYLYKFNLPIPSGGDYNKIEGEYLVLAGKSKTDLKPVGKLQRSSDGWFYLQDITKEDYKYTQVLFNVQSDTSKNMIILEKTI